jgi:cob(I)alamin adenosyltransferase
MINIAIKEDYAEILGSFGDLQSAINLAVQRYTIEKITTKIAELKQKNFDYEIKYHSDYPTFCQKIQQDEKFITYLEDKVEKLWEIDLSDWEFSYRGITDWTEKLQTILLA